MCGCGAKLKWYILIAVDVSSSVKQIASGFVGVEDEYLLACGGDVY